MIWIIGGTSEAVDLIKAVQKKIEVVVSVATEAGTEFLPACHVKVGRMNAEEMTRFIRDHHIRTIIDASHPYAVEVTASAKQAGQQAGISYVRFSRPKADTESATFVKSLAECLQYLETLTGCVFFTTGSKDIGQFEPLRGKNRFVYRVLPTPESIEQCKKNGVRLKDIIAALGPFSLELNKAIFREVKADYVVMKNSGKRGGTAEKIEACRQLRIKAVVIDRDDETGFTDLNRLMEYLLKT